MKRSGCCNFWLSIFLLSVLIVFSNESVQATGFKELLRKTFQLKKYIRGIYVDEQEYGFSIDSVVYDGTQRIHVDLDRSGALHRTGQFLEWSYYRSHTFTFIPENIDSSEWIRMDTLEGRKTIDIERIISNQPQNLQWGYYVIRIKSGDDIRYVRVVVKGPSEIELEKTTYYLDDPNFRIDLNITLEPRDGVEEYSQVEYYFETPDTYHVFSGGAFLKTITVRPETGPVGLKGSAGISFVCTAPGVKKISLKICGRKYHVPWITVLDKADPMDHLALAVNANNSDQSPENIPDFRKVELNADDPDIRQVLFSISRGETGFHLGSEASEPLLQEWIDEKAKVTLKRGPNTCVYSSPRKGLDKRLLFSSLEQYDKKQNTNGTMEFELEGKTLAQVKQFFNNIYVEGISPSQEGVDDFLRISVEGTDLVYMRELTITCVRIRLPLSGSPDQVRDTGSNPIVLRVQKANITAEDATRFALDASRGAGDLVEWSIIPVESTRKVIVNGQPVIEPVSAGDANFLGQTTGTKVNIYGTRNGPIDIGVKIAGNPENYLVMRAYVGDELVIPFGVQTLAGGQQDNIDAGRAMEFLMEAVEPANRILAQAGIRLRPTETALDSESRRLLCSSEILFKEYLMGEWSPRETLYDISNYIYVEAPSFPSLNNHPLHLTLYGPGVAEAPENIMVDKIRVTYGTQTIIFQKSYPGFLVASPAYVEPFLYKKNNPSVINSNGPTASITNVESWIEQGVGEKSGYIYSTLFSYYPNTLNFYILGDGVPSDKERCFTAGIYPRNRLGSEIPVLLDSEEKKQVELNLGKSNYSPFSRDVGPIGFGALFTSRSRILEMQDDARRNAVVRDMVHEILIALGLKETAPGRDRAFYLPRSDSGGLEISHGNLSANNFHEELTHAIPLEEAILVRENILCRSIFEEE